MIRTQSKAMLFVALFFAANMLTGCEVIGGIFKAGMGVGIFVVVVIVALVLWLIGRSRK
jgi:hypothetical protein